MPFYSFEMILVGIILLSGMAAGGVKIWLKRKQNPVGQLDQKNDFEQQKNP